jgi:hypothetical protein
MGGAICFNGPAGQQQTQNDTKNHLFLFRQVIHQGNVTKQRRSATTTLLWELRRVCDWILTWAIQAGKAWMVCGG